jgi:flagellar biosynthetic protein FliP
VSGRRVTRGAVQPARLPGALARVALARAALLLPALLLIAWPALAQAQPLDGLTLLSAAPGHDGDTYSLNVETLLLITGLAFLPGILLLMTAFTRIIIVLAILRQALGLQTTPPNMVLAALALALTIFVMRGVIQQEQDKARKQPLHLFVDLSGGHYDSAQDVPLTVLVPAFATSELETAFQIGFLIYIPFVLIDLAVASVLMSLGMIMVSPTLISLPLKLLMFVSIHGWVLVLGSVANSFSHPGG